MEVKKEGTGRLWIKSGMVGVFKHPVVGLQKWKYLTEKRFLLELRNYSFGDGRKYVTQRDWSFHRRDFRLDLIFGKWTDLGQEDRITTISSRRYSPRLYYTNTSSG